MPDHHQPVRTRKRRSSTDPVPQPKRQKLAPRQRNSSERQYWDTLSKVWLTKYALRELDRRNSEVVHHSARQPRRPVTRSFSRQLSADIERILPAEEFLDCCSPDAFEGLQKSARLGGADLSDLRGYPEPVQERACVMSSAHNSSGSRDRRRRSESSSRGKTSTTPTTITRSTKSSRPKDANYQQMLIDEGIYPYGYKYADGGKLPVPANWDVINQRLAQHRPSLSPSRFPEDDYQDFIQADAEAHNEDAVKESVLPAMLRTMRASDGAQRNVLFTNMAPMVDGIAQPKPDYYYGIQPEHIDRTVREELSDHIVPSSHSHLPAVPNFSMEAKGPDGSLAEALRQSCHNGAVGARAMHSLRTYGEEEPAYDNTINAISSTYQGGQLKLYGHSVGQPNGPGTRPEYYMRQLKGWSMTGDEESFRRGATAFKNAADLTTEYRHAAVARANEVARRRLAAQHINEEDDEEDHDDEDGEDHICEEHDEDDESDEDDEESVSALAASTTTSFAADATRRTCSTITPEEQEEEQSETSFEDERRGPPSKRSSKAQSSRRDRSRKSRKTSANDSGKAKTKAKQRSWFGW